MFAWLRARAAQKYIEQRQRQLAAQRPAPIEGDDELAFRGFQTVEVDEMAWAHEHAPTWELK